MNAAGPQSTWPARRQAIQYNARRIAERGGIAAACVGGLSSALAPVGIGLLLGKAAFIAGPFVLAIAVRMGVVQVASQQARHRGRRTLMRWLPRLLWLLLLPAWTASPVPVLNIFVLPAIVVAFTGITTAYATWTVDRDVAGTPPHQLEWVVLAMAIAVGVTLLVVVAFTTVAVGLVVQWLSQFWT